MFHFNYLIIDFVQFRSLLLWTSTLWKFILSNEFGADVARQDTVGFFELRLLPIEHIIVIKLLLANITWSIEVEEVIIGHSCLVRRLIQDNVLLSDGRLTQAPSFACVSL